MLIIKRLLGGQLPDSEGVDSWVMLASCCCLPSAVRALLVSVGRFVVAHWLWLPVTTCGWSHFTDGVVKHPNVVIMGVPTVKM